MGTRRSLRVRTLLCVAAVSSFVFCFGQFPTRYERIEDDRVRQLGFVFSTAEAAPGDTVAVRALFSGESVDSIVWRLSLDYRFDPLGVSGADTALTVFRLDTSATAVGQPSAPMQGVGHQYGLATFRLPRDLIRTNAMVPEYPLALLPDSVLDSIPAPLRNVSRDDILDLVEQLAYGDPAQSPLPIDSSSAAMIGMLSQLLTVKIMVYADAYSGGYLYKTRGTYIVRYNRLLQRNLGLSSAVLPVNANPRIGWFGIYKVRGAGLISFDPLRDSWDFDFYRLYRDSALVRGGDRIVDLGPGRRIIDSDTVPIDTGCTYFFGADSAEGNRDTAVTYQGAVDREDYFYDWFYAPGDYGAVHPDSVLMFGSTRNPIVRLETPVSPVPAFYEFHVLLFVWDSFLGERLRPIGNSFASAKCRFELTEKYAGRLRGR